MLTTLGVCTVAVAWEWWRGWVGTAIGRNSVESAEFWFWAFGLGCLVAAAYVIPFYLRINCRLIYSLICRGLAVNVFFKTPTS